MILGFTLLLVCQLAGEAVSRLLALPVPGPVIGLALFLAFLALRHALAPARASATVESAERVADGLLRNLAFLFVPAGVGVVGQMSVIGSHGWALGLTLVCSTILTLAVTVGVFLLVKSWTGADEDGDARP